MGVLRRGVRDGDPRQPVARSWTRPTRSSPRLNQAFVEYAQARGFVIDPARVRRPQDKPRVERTVPFVRNSRSSPGRPSSTWPTPNAGPRSGARRRPGLRVHGTTPCRPAELFALEEAPRLLPGARRRPTTCRSTPRAKVHRDHHIEVGQGAVLGAGQPDRRPGRRPRRPRLVRVFHRGALVKIHPRQATRAGARPTPPTCRRTRPPTRMRDLDHLQRLAAGARPTRSAPTPPPCWSTRCPGPRCARSTPCSAWSRVGARNGSTPPARGRWRPKRSTSR